MAEMVHIDYFVTPKEDLKITEIFRDEELYREIEEQSRGQKSLPDANEFYTTPLAFPKAPEDRPYAVSSIVLSADGKMAYMDNKVGPLIAKMNKLDPAGGAGDFWVLNMLRAYADALLIGANTLRNEPNYINCVMDSNLMQQRREVLGKPDQPVQVLSSRDGTDIPFDHITFRMYPEERAKVIISTSPDGWDYIQKNSPLKHMLVGPFADCAQVDAAQLPSLTEDFDVFPVIVCGEGDLPDMKVVMYTLRKMGIELTCAESPTYCGAMMEQGFLDEYFINYSMVYVGGNMTPGVIFPKSWQDHPHADLVSVGIHRRNFLFTRQKIRYGL